MLVECSTKNFISDISIPLNPIQLLNIKKEITKRYQLAQVIDQEIPRNTVR